MHEDQQSIQNLKLFIYESLCINSAKISNTAQCNFESSRLRCKITKTSFQYWPIFLRSGLKCLIKCHCHCAYHIKSLFLNLKLLNMFINQITQITDQPIFGYTTLQSKYTSMNNRRNRNQPHLLINNLTIIIEIIFPHKKIQHMQDNLPTLQLYQTVHNN